MKKKHQSSLFRRIVEFIHLWLGLISGIVLFCVCLTAGIWVFRDEITWFTMPENRIAPQERAYLTPSELTGLGHAYLHQHGKDTTKLNMYMITYREPGLATSLEYEWAPEQYGYLLMSPYDGHVTYEGAGETRTDKFLLFLRAGHRFFWLPRSIGSPFVGISCLVFMVLLITGLIWWYPKKWNASTRKKSFNISWTSNWKRVNIDLHNVLGFYAFIVALILAITGVTYTFTWFNNGYHAVLTGKAYTEEVWRMDSKQPVTTPQDMRASADTLWRRYGSTLDKGNHALFIGYPSDSADSWQVTTVPIQGRITANTRYYHDQHDLQLLGQSADHAAKPTGEKLYDMTFDIHVGTIWGLTSKIIASLACLVGASLPVTGFIIWYNRKFGKKKKREKRPARAVV